MGVVIFGCNRTAFIISEKRANITLSQHTNFLEEAFNPVLFSDTLDNRAFPSYLHATLHASSFFIASYDCKRFNSQAMFCPSTHFIGSINTQLPKSKGGFSRYPGRGKMSRRTTQIYSKIWT
jgi:hypothetical protein